MTLRSSAVIEVAGLSVAMASSGQNPSCFVWPMSRRGGSEPPGSLHLFESRNCELGPRIVRVFRWPIASHATSRLEADHQCSGGYWSTPLSVRSGRYGVHALHPSSKLAARSVGAG